MAGNQTFTMIKPTAFRKNYAGSILKMITEAGFQVRAMKLTKLTSEQAGSFYAVHRGKPFYESLVQFMSSGTVIAMILEKENAVEAFRNFIGATNPENAAKGTIRKLYGTSLQQNAVHGSDSDENAVIEADFFFSKMERFND
jgi:nucleoside-diphosphate kinase